MNERMNERTTINAQDIKYGQRFDVAPNIGVKFMERENNCWSNQNLHSVLSDSSSNSYRQGQA